jgi:anaerobic selenocysteine-containing dehydrogenase
MNETVRNISALLRTGASACPHDCPSTCALEVELLDACTIGRVRGAKDNSYTAGVVCAKVARYAERVHHPARLTTPLRRKGRKGEGSAEFEALSWDDALDITAEALRAAERRHGPEAVWPYYYAGTMGLVMRDGINRLRHAKRYSGFHSTICVNPAWSGFTAGTGKLAGPDPREMAKSDLVVIWGTNAVSTQVNVMTHAIRARLVGRCPRYHGGGPDPRRAAPWRRGGVALLLCRHHGPRDARRHPPLAPRQEIFRLPLDDLRQSRLQRLRRRRRQDRRSRSA